MAPARRFSEENREDVRIPSRAFGSADRPARRAHRLSAPDPPRARTPLQVQHPNHTESSASFNSRRRSMQREHLAARCDARAMRLEHLAARCGARAMRLEHLAARCGARAMRLEHLAARWRCASHVFEQLAARRRCASHAFAQLAARRRCTSHVFEQLAARRRCHLRDDTIVPDVRACAGLDLRSLVAIQTSSGFASTAPDISSLALDARGARVPQKSDRALLQSQSHPPRHRPRHGRN